MAQIRMIQRTTNSAVRPLRVAAYARVSHTDLLQSLGQQISYYKELIQSNPAWVYSGVYSDSALSGRTQGSRSGFQDLIADCLAGQIDLILTKSISRFGRNTLDLLKTVRALRDRGIGVRFEKEGIDTLTSEGELLLTLLASLAQEESDSISQNIRWKIRKKFEQGLPHSPQDMYGYRWKGEEYVIEPHEAEVVKEIFSWYLDGRSASSIAKELEGRGVCTRRGNRFTKRVIHNILNQEAYTGQLVLQKTYRPAFGHRSVENKGQMSKYLVEQAHEAIVSQALFKAVQEEKRQRASRRRSKHEGVGLFQGRVYCGQCQLDMIYSLEKKKDGARRIRYSCRTRAKSGVTACSNRTITEEAIVTQLQQQGISPQEIKRLAFNSRTKELIIIYREHQTGVIPLTERTRP